MCVCVFIFNVDIKIELVQSNVMICSSQVRTLGLFGNKEPSSFTMTAAEVNTHTHTHPVDVCRAFGKINESQKALNKFSKNHFLFSAAHLCIIYRLDLP